MNWAVDDEERARRDRVRIKLLTSILTSYGYAVLAGSFWTPLTEGDLHSVNLWFAAFGIVLHAAALYIAPRGEL